MMTSSTKSLGQQNPSLDLNLPSVKHEIAQKLIDLKICEVDLKTTTDAYNDCAKNNHGTFSFWQTPAFIAGEFVISVSFTTAFICITHFMGACR